MITYSINIHQYKDFFYQWKKKQNTYYISNEEIDLEQTDDVETILNYIQNANTNFSLIVENEHFIFLCVDAIRSFPLFYQISKNRICITNRIKREKTDEIDTSEKIFFIQNFCTQNERTLLKNWKQIQAGEYLLIDKKSQTFQTNFYINYANSKEVYLKNDEQVYEYMLQKMKKFVKNNEHKTFAIPLSGGYDSRSILCLLKDAGAKKITTYTYGNRFADEKKMAAKVAKKLNLPWIFIEYKSSLLDIFFNDVWQQYANNNHHYTSLPHEQDFFALYYLQQQKLIPENAIFLPGFLGDYFAGSMYKDEYSMKTYNNTIDEKYLNWYMRNRASKFIVNAVRSFEYFRQAWYLPLYDKHLMSYFFSKLDNNTSTNYENFLMHYIFKKHGVDYYKNKPSKIKNRWKRILPEKIVRKYQQYNATKPANNPINSSLLSKKISTFDPTCFGENINQIHAKYFLKKIDHEENNPT